MTTSLQAQLSAALDAAVPEQPAIRELLKRIVVGGHLSHAYLFVGPVGAAKTKTAQAFASAIICDYDAIAGRGNPQLSVTDERIRVAHGTHPDVRHIHPEGSSGYLIGQIRELVDDVQIQPKRSAHKVYVVHRADLLNQESANALLKTLEEPPSYVTIILIARHQDAILPTIRSRCQTVAFAPIAPQHACQVVVDRLGCSREVALQALDICAYSTSDALEFLKDAHRQKVRTTTVMLCARLSCAPAHELLSWVKEVIALAQIPCDEMARAHEELLDEQAQSLSKGVVNELKMRHKRELSAKQRASIMEILAIMRSYLHDVLKASQLTDACLINGDVATSIYSLAASTSLAQITQCFRAIECAELRLRSNVSPQLTLEALLFELKEVLLCLPS